MLEWNIAKVNCVTHTKHIVLQIPRQNIVALSRCVENRAKAVIGQRLNVNTAGVVDLIVWGNVNGQHFIDTSKVVDHAVCVCV